MKQYRSGVAPVTNTPKKRRRTKQAPYSIEEDFFRLVESFSFFRMTFRREGSAWFYTYYLTRDGITTEVQDLGEAHKILGERWMEWGGKK